MEYTTIGEACSVVSGGTPSRSKNEYWESGNIPWIKIGNLKEKHVKDYDEKITEQGLNNSSAKMLAKGTILYTIFATLGEVGILDIEACTNQAIAGISINDPRLTTDYLYYYLKSKKDYVNKIGRGVAQNNINLSALKKFEIPLISIEEQSTIVDVLEKVENLIDEKKKLIEDLDLFIKARFIEMFGDLKPITTMSRYIVELRSGKSLAGTEICKNKVLKTGAATFGWFDSEQYKYLPTDYEPLAEHKVETGDVIISRMNTPELVGACSYVFEAPENMYYPDRLWKVIVQENTNPIFLWQLFWDKEIRRQIKEKSGGTSGTMHNISKPKLLEVKCIDAPIDLQNEFASFVEQVDKSKFA